MRGEQVSADEFVEVGLVIGGERLLTGRWDEHPNPAREVDVVGRSPVAGAKEVDLAVEAAAGAFPAWAALDLSERAALLAAAGDMLQTRSAEWEALLTREHGRPLYESRLDIQFGGAVLRYFGSECSYPEPRVFEDGQGRLTVGHRPIGVCAGIVPWNFPVGLSMPKVGAALLAGNTIVIKLPDYSPLTAALVLGEVADLLPPGVLNVVTGRGPEVGQLLAEHPTVRKVALTGGTPTGRAVMRAASEQLKRVTLELGGNDAAIVLPDAQVDQTLGEKLMLGAFTASGQICFAIKRVYAPRRVFADVVEAIAAALDDSLLGDGLEPGVTLGPVNNRRSHERLNRLRAGLDKIGANTLIRGSVVPGTDLDAGYFQRPTLVVDPPRDAEIVKVEQFGPILPILAYDDDEDPIGLANDSEFGLCASLWTADEGAAFDLASRIESGTVFINSHGPFSLDLSAPFGGVKASGLGREFGVEGLSEYLDVQTVSNRGL
ncbi:MAG: aldehyde dehydrogenase family protein [Actinomycetota bacterium]